MTTNNNNNLKRSKMKNLKEEQMQQPLPYTQEELNEYIEETISWVHEPPAVLMHIVAKWVTEKFISSQLRRSETFVCGHPPKRTYLLNGTWYCEECGGKWKSIANK